MKSRKKWKCLDCNVDTGKIYEHYFINLQTWLSVVNSKNGMLCIGCLETRLNRQLNKHDFTNCHINNPKLNRMSLRLIEALNRENGD